MLKSLALIALISFGTCFGKIYENVAHLPRLEYDFVIVGMEIVLFKGWWNSRPSGGNRLTENPKISVLVLEAGVSNEGVISSTIPFLINDLLLPNIYEWNYTTTPQPGLNGRVLKYLRGQFSWRFKTNNQFEPRLKRTCWEDAVHTVSSFSSNATFSKSTDLMFYTRGPRDDFDRYAKLTGDPGWSWDRIFPYFLKNEKWVPPADLHDTKGQFNPAVHSTHGMNPVSLSGFAWPAGNLVTAATKELHDEFPFNLDMNSGDPLGVGWLQLTVGGGKRSTSATSYLEPIAQRKNLHVLLHAQVTRLVNPNHANGILMFGGVEFVQPGLSPFIAKATKEIILSAGTVGTPHILMHSGVGDATALRALGIPVLLDNPSVGQNVSDHVSVGLSWSVNSNKTIESISQNATAFNEAFAQYNKTHTGPFVEVGSTNVGWLRLDPQSEIFEEFPDPSAGPTAPHIELIFSAGFTLRSAATPQGHFMNIGAVMVTPLSRGSITLNSSNALVPPLIDPQFLASDFDLFVVRDGLKRAQRFVTAPVFKDYILAPTVNIANLTSDELDQFIRNSAGTISHLVGSAGMSARGARYGVVDPDLTVKGIARLSIIDASVLVRSQYFNCIATLINTLKPIVPSAHTQAATYVIAERGADLVKTRWA
ncbi:aryl-alcohol oxidase [Mycena leptocephala]|nr:aryl-alcohol oxidase [Mycena leptocephala]